MQDHAKKAYQHDETNWRALMLYGISLIEDYSNMDQRPNTVSNAVKMIQEAYDKVQTIENLTLDEREDIKVVRYLSRKVEWLKHLK